MRAAYCHLELRGLVVIGHVAAIVGRAMRQLGQAVAAAAAQSGARASGHRLI